ncbi:transposase [Geobacillus sp. Y412MC52]|uniref:transposase n=1 Tax=Geobacillus sp. (strain Y412MC52) TaxID=550542 RepID=UPI001E57887E|nr:transposase [Geobacillus sp. Y412MC52]
MYLDETHIRSYHVLRSTWSEVGHQKQVPTFGHHAHVSLLGAVNIHDGETVLHQLPSRCRTRDIEKINIPMVTEILLYLTINYTIL